MAGSIRIANAGLIRPGDRIAVVRIEPANNDLAFIEELDRLAFSREKTRIRARSDTQRVADATAAVCAIVNRSDRRDRSRGLCVLRRVAQVRIRAFVCDRCEEVRERRGRDDVVGADIDARCFIEITTLSSFTFARNVPVLSPVAPISRKTIVFVPLCAVRLRAIVCIKPEVGVKVSRTIPFQTTSSLALFASDVSFA